MQARLGLIQLGQGQREANASLTRADATWGRAQERLMPDH